MPGVLAGGTHTIMARRAVTADAGMIERRRSPSHCRMTGIAFLRNRNVIDRLASSTHAVVTIRTTANNASVVETCAVPVQCAVTGAAIHAGLHMSRRLADGLHVVVTSLTGAGDFGVIEQARRYPRGGDVAVIALGAGENVVGRLGACQYACAGGVTSHTGRRRTFEHAIDVTTFTTHQPVFTGQIKASGEVIELTHQVAGRGRATRLRLLILRVSSHLYAKHHA